MPLGCHKCVTRWFGLAGLGQDGGDYGGETYSPDIPITPPIVAPGSISVSSSSGLGVNWTSILQPITNTGMAILKAQYGGPQPGQYFATSPTGQSVAYALPQGASSTGFSFTSPFGTSVGTASPLLIYGGLALLAVLAFRNR
jgi:hypothetical protein